MPKKKEELEVTAAAETAESGVEVANLALPAILQQHIGFQFPEVYPRSKKKSEKLNFLLHILHFMKIASGGRFGYSPALRQFCISYKWIAGAISHIDHRT